jgi:serine-type D-Ala-D-Ala carboxypeptidase (penicillin-binding protein 5/6)
MQGELREPIASPEVQWAPRRFTARRSPTGSSKQCALRAMYFSARIDPMRFSTTGRTSIPSVVSSAPHKLSHAVTLGIVLPATLAASTAFAQVPPPAVNARSWVLVDATSNQVLASGNADERVEPASLTKLMTAYLVFEALQTKKITMDQTVMPSEAVRRVKTDESRMFIEANKPVTVHDLVYGMIIQSGNDAAIALAELVGGSESQFVNMMNTEAQRLGMKHTHFADVNGMPDPQHYTTAGDLAVLSARLIRDFPDYYNIFSVKEFKYNNIKQPNRNRLLWIDPTVDGLKTGHTQAAGYCLIASAKRPLPGTNDASRRLVSVMMGETKEHDRVQDSLKMLNYGYTAYDTTRLYKAGQVVGTPRVYKGSQDSVQIGVKSDQYITVPKGMADKVKPQIDQVDTLIAPIANGQQVGTAKLIADGKVLAQFPVVALQAVPQAGVVGRVWDSLMLMFNKKK